MIEEWSPPPDYVELESAVEGVSVFAPSTETAAAAPETFACPRCAAPVAYDPRASGLTCDHCGHALDDVDKTVGRSASEFEFETSTLQQARRGWGAPRRELSCESCNGALTLAEGELTTQCPFCGSNRVVARAAPQDLLRPRYLVPFKVDEGSLAGHLRRWLGKSWMYPSQLRRAVASAAAVGTYLPFWTFDTRILADWEAEVGHTRVKTRWDGGKLKTSVETEWVHRSGHVELQIDDHVESGSTRAPRELLRRIQSFDIAGLVAYEPRFVVGWRAQAYDLALEPAWDGARATLRDRARHECRARVEQGPVRNFAVVAEFDDERWRYVLLPVYLAGYRFGGRTYHVMVNGQTGQVAGQKPVARGKIAAAVAAALVPGGALGLLGLTTMDRGGAPFLLAGALVFLLGLVTSGVILHKARALEEEV